MRRACVPPRRSREAVPAQEGSLASNSQQGRNHPRRNAISRRHFTLVVGITAALTCAVAQDARAEEVADHGYRPNIPLITSGFITFGIPYTISVFVAATSPRDEDRALFIPLVGPWIDLASRRCGAPGGTCGGETAEKAGLIVDGIFQGLGVLTMASGLLWRSRSATAARSASIDWVSPWASGTGGGLSAVGHF